MQYPTGESEQFKVWLNETTDWPYEIRPRQLNRKERRKQAALQRTAA